MGFRKAIPPPQPKVPKPTKPVQFAAKANIRDVNWERDAPAGVNVPAGVKDRLAALSIEHSSQRKELDILRKTRGQRDVGSLKVPAHLQAGIPMAADDVKPRAQLAQVLPAEE